MCVIYWASCCFSSHKIIRVITRVIYGKEKTLKYPFIFLEGLILLKTYFSSEWEWEILSKAPSGNCAVQCVEKVNCNVWVSRRFLLLLSTVQLAVFFFFQWIGALIFLSLWPELSFYISLPFCVSFSLPPSFFFLSLSSSICEREDFKSWQRAF